MFAIILGVNALIHELLILIYNVSYLICQVSEAAVEFTISIFKVIHILSLLHCYCKKPGSTRLSHKERLQLIWWGIKMIRNYQERSETAIVY